MNCPFCNSADLMILTRIEPIETDGPNYAFRTTKGDGPGRYLCGDCGDQWDEDLTKEEENQAARDEADFWDRFGQRRF